MEKIINELEILRAEHDALEEGANEWMGLQRDTAMEDVEYIRGVVDVTSQLLRRARGEDA